MNQQPFRQYLLDLFGELQRVYPTRASVRHCMGTAPNPYTGEMELFIRVFGDQEVYNILVDNEDFEKTPAEVCEEVKRKVGQLG